MASRRKGSVPLIFHDLDLKNPVANAANRKKYPWLQKVAEDLRDATTEAAKAGASAMRDTILNSPTGSDWHVGINIQRGKRPPYINMWGSRYETGTMYNSVDFRKGRITQAKDRRRRGSVNASFGWPATASGQIADAPTSPIGRKPDGPGWRDDPKYFVMQEYGFNNEGTAVPGMNSQKAGLDAAMIKIQQEMRKRGYKG
jgi:hypothetical protein